MSKTDVIHETFVIERTYAQPPARVFAAFADEALKRRWFADEGHGGAMQSYANDFRVGGKETSRSRLAGEVPNGPPPGTQLGNDTVYMDIVPNERIVFAYAMLVGDYRISTSLATVQLRPEGSGTRLVFTEQAAFFDRSDGPKLRREGWTGLLAKIDHAIA